MPKFLVRVSGENYSIKVVTRRLFFFKRKEVKRVGLTTTRFIEADNANLAIDGVMDRVRGELEAEGRTTPDSFLELVEIREDADAFDEFAPGTGYTFSLEE